LLIFHLPTNYVYHPGTGAPELGVFQEAGAQIKIRSQSPV